MEEYRTWVDLLEEEETAAPEGGAVVDASAGRAFGAALPPGLVLSQELLELQAERERLEKQLESLTGQGEPDPEQKRLEAMFPTPVRPSAEERRRLRREGALRNARLPQRTKAPAGEGPRAEAKLEQLRRAKRKVVRRRQEEGGLRLSARPPVEPRPGVEREAQREPERQRAKREVEPAFEERRRVKREPELAFEERPRVRREGEPAFEERPRVKREPEPAFEERPRAKRKADPGFEERPRVKREPERLLETRPRAKHEVDVFERRSRATREPESELERRPRVKRERPPELERGPRAQRESEPKLERRPRATREPEPELERRLRVRREPELRFERLVELGLDRRNERAMERRRSIRRGMADLDLRLDSRTNARWE